MPKATGYQVKLWGVDITNEVEHIEVFQFFPAPGVQAPDGLSVLCGTQHRSAIALMEDGQVKYYGLEFSVDGNQVWQCPTLAWLN